MKAQRNSESAAIAKLRRDGVDTAAQQQKVREIGDRITRSDEKVRELDESFKALLAGIPNVTARVGAGRARARHDNVEVRRWGTAAASSISRPKAHWDLGADLGILDLERAAKVTGARFAVYWDLGAKLERALINFMLDVHTREHGYTEVLPPFMVNSASLFGTGNLPKFAADLFKCENFDLWLAPDGRSAGDESVSRRDAERATICPSACAPTRPVSGARPDRTGATCGASSGSTSFRKWNW